jgi:AraC family transcriptional regulator
MTAPRIETLNEKKLAGKRLRMTLSNNETATLWRSFMPLRKTITNTVTQDLISMQVYDPNFNFQDLTLDTPFTKWAVTEVSDFATVPPEMETYTLQGGLYAVFIHRGTPADFQKTFDFIFKEWIPHSGYAVDNREHFEVLGEKYKNNDPLSEEEIWIPVRVHS